LFYAFPPEVVETVPEVQPAPTLDNTLVKDFDTLEPAGNEYFVDDTIRIFSEVSGFSGNLTYVVEVAGLTYFEESAEQNFSSEFSTVNLDPGKYDIIFTVVDMIDGSVVQDNMTVMLIEPDSIQISEPILGYFAEEFVEDDPFYLAGQDVMFVYTVKKYEMVGGQADVDLNVAVYDEFGFEYYSDEPFKVTSGPEYLDELILDTTNWLAGEYMIEITATDNIENRSITKTKTIFLQ
jgi:hypothetical protein